jgi:hypothetical protein
MIARVKPATDWKAEVFHLDEIFHVEPSHGKKVTKRSEKMSYDNEEANSVNLFEEIRSHVAKRLDIPLRIGRTLLQAYDSYQDGSEPDLTAALGLRRPRKTARDGLRRSAWLGLSVAGRILLEVRGQHYFSHKHTEESQGVTIDRELFESVGKLFNPPLTNSKVERIYLNASKDAKVHDEIGTFVQVFAKANADINFLNTARKRRG